MLVRFTRTSDQEFRMSPQRRCAGNQIAIGADGLANYLKELAQDAAPWNCAIVAKAAAQCHVLCEIRLENAVSIISQTDKSVMNMFLNGGVGDVEVNGLSV